MSKMQNPPYPVDADGDADDYAKPSVDDGTNKPTAETKRHEAKAKMKQAEHGDCTPQMS